MLLRRIVIGGYGNKKITYKEDIRPPARQTDVGLAAGQAMRYYISHCTSAELKKE